jgi:hypothetical protein
MKNLKYNDEVRHYCRNPRCRSKLPAPVRNPREAFCTRGCYDSFYLHHCLICERPIKQPKRGKRVICKKATCRSACEVILALAATIDRSLQNQSQRRPILLA